MGRTYFINRSNQMEVLSSFFRAGRSGSEIEITISMNRPKSVQIGPNGAEMTNLGHPIRINIFSLTWTEDQTLIFEAHLAEPEEHDDRLQRRLQRFSVLGYVGQDGKGECRIEDKKKGVSYHLSNLRSVFRSAPLLSRMTRHP